MDIEEVKKFLKEDSKGKKLLADLVEDHEALEGLKSKNGDLIASNKKLKKERDDAVGKIDTLESTIEDLEEKGGDADVEKATAKLKKELEKKDKIIKEKDDIISETSGKYSSKVIESDLADALAKAKIAPQHVKAIKALLKSENKIEIDETDHIAKIGDKPLGDFVSEWAQGDIGKNYVVAANNSGGGANGSGNGGGKSGDDLMKLSPKQRLIEGRKQAENK